MTEIKRSDFSKICRTCLLQKENMEPIYKSNIPKMLLSFTNVKVDFDDELPRLICAACVGKIDMCYEFKTQCELNQEILQMTLMSTDEPSEPVSNEHTIKIEPVENIKTKSWNVNGIENDNDDREADSFESENEKQAKKPGKSNESVKRKRIRTISDPCYYCKKKFVDKYALKRHIEDMHTKIREKETCEICNRDVMDMRRHLQRQHIGEYKYKCREEGCDAEYLYKAHLTEHVREKHTNNVAKKANILCTNCGKVLHSHGAYVYHMLWHNSEKPFQCSFCKKKFRSRKHLKVHERQHTDERPYPCTYCERAFRSSTTLKKHIRTHTGEKPYVCPICSRAFTQSFAMKTHLKIH